MRGTRRTFMVLVLMLIASLSFPANVSSKGSLLTAQYSFESNFNVFINLRPDTVSMLCGSNETVGRINSNYYAIFNPNQTIVEIGLSNNSVLFKIVFHNITILHVEQNDVKMICSVENRSYSLMYNASQVVLPVYEGVISGGFPYVGTKIYINSTGFIIASIGSLDFESMTPSYLSNETRRVPLQNNLLAVQPTARSKADLKPYVSILKDVLGGIARVKTSPSSEGYTIEAFPSNKTVGAVDVYGVVLRSPPGSPYSYGNISFPATMVSSYSPSTCPTAIVRLGDYRAALLDGDMYFPVNAGLDYVVTMELIPPSLSGSKYSLYSISYYWNKGILLQGRFNWLMVYPAVQGFLLQGPILDDLALGEAVHMFIYGIIPPGKPPAKFLQSLVSNSENVMNVPRNAVFNVHLSKLEVEVQNERTVTPSSGSSWMITSVYAGLILAVVVGLILLYKRKF